MSRDPLSARLRLSLIGPIGAWNLGSDDVAPRGRKSRALLALLALSDAHVPRERAAALLWSRSGPDQARASLRQAVHELQAALSPCGAPVLVAERDALRLEQALLWCDAREVAAATPARPQALDLLTAPLAEDLDGIDRAFDGFLADQRARLSDHATATARALWEAAGPATRLPAAKRLLAIRPEAEEVARTTIAEQIAAGDRDGALATYADLRAALRHAGRAPDPETERLAARLSGPLPPPSRATRRGAGGARIGVLPLLPLGPETPGHLASGLAEEISGALARFRWLFLADPASLAAAARDAPDALAAAAEQGLDFALSGTVQRDGSRLRVSLRLSDLRTPRRLLWTERFDREAADLLALNDEIAAELVARMDPELLLLEANRAPVARTADATAWDLVLSAIPAFYRLDREGYLAAGLALAQACERDPDYAAAHSWYAAWHLFLVGQGWAADRESALAAAEAHASRATALDPADAQALTIRGHVLAYLHHQPDEASALHERALALNPNLAIAWVLAGLAHTYAGRHRQAIACFERYRRIAPLHPHAFFFDAARLVPMLLAHEHELAAHEARQAHALHPGFTATLRIWLSAAGHLGRTVEAREVRDKLLALEPGLTIAGAMDRAPLRPQDRAHYARGLALAGLPAG